MFDAIKILIYVGIHLSFSVNFKYIPRVNIRIQNDEKIRKIEKIFYQKTSSVYKKAPQVTRSCQWGSSAKHDAVSNESNRRELPFDSISFVNLSLTLRIKSWYSLQLGTVSILQRKKSLKLRTENFHKWATHSPNDRKFHVYSLGLWSTPEICHQLWYSAYFRNVYLSPNLRTNPSRRSIFRFVEF